MTLYCMYVFCQQFGLIESFKIPYTYHIVPDHAIDIIDITFKRSPRTDQLKPKRSIFLEGHTIILKWDKDDDKMGHDSNADESMHDAPLQQSSGNIVTILMLNDDCLTEIFSYLDRFDLCSTAHVCRRFRTISQKIIKSKPFKSIEITEENDGPLWKWEKYFLMFGDAIQTVNALESESIDIFMVFVLLYCPHITVLNGDVYDKRTLNQLIPLFMRLRELRLPNATTLDGLITPSPSYLGIA